MKFSLQRAITLALCCGLACASAARAEQVTISLGMSFDQVVEAIQKCGGKDEGADASPLGHKWSLPESFDVVLELGEHYGKLSYLTYHPLREFHAPATAGGGRAPAAPTSYDPYADRPLQSLTIDTETHQVKGEWLPPGSPAPVQSQRWQVRVELLVAMLPQELALALLPDLRDEDKVDAAYTQIIAAIGRKEARLLGYPVIQTPSGQKATSETVFEKIYPTQFLPPDGPQMFSAPRVPKPGEIASRNAVPTAFEKRNAGIMLAVEPVVLEGGKRINLIMESQRVDFDGMDSYEFAVAPEVSGKIEQPRFFVTKESFETSFRHGQRVLVGFHKSLRGDEVEIHLVQTLATPVP